MLTGDVESFAATVAAVPPSVPSAVLNATAMFEAEPVTESASTVADDAVARTAVQVRKSVPLALSCGEASSSPNSTPDSEKPAAAGLLAGPFAPMKPVSPLPPILSMSVATVALSANVNVPVVCSSSIAPLMLTVSRIASSTEPPMRLTSCANASVCVTPPTVIERLIAAPVAFRWTLSVPESVTPSTPARPADALASKA